jgi:hypothetical protein
VREGAKLLSWGFYRGARIRSVTQAFTFTTKNSLCTFFTVYEYGDTEGSEPDGEGSHQGAGEEVDGDGDDIAPSDDESAGGQTDEDDDGIRRDWSDDDEPSW